MKDSKAHHGRRARKRRHARKKLIKAAVALAGLITACATAWQVVSSSAEQPAAPAQPTVIVCAGHCQIEEVQSPAP